MVNFGDWMTATTQRAFVCISLIVIVPWLIERELSFDTPVRTPNASNDPALDIVITWVNGTDPRFLDQLNYHKEQLGMITSDSAAKERFEETNELLYSFRSIDMYMPWARNLYLLTNLDHKPRWARQDLADLHFVTHKDIWPDPNKLPVFNSAAIESHLHRIPNISRRFLYSNDDTFIMSEIRPQDIWSPEGGLTVRMSDQPWRCFPGCRNYMLGDGICQEKCNNLSCMYDFGDCGREPTPEEIKEKGPTTHRMMVLNAEMIANRELGYHRDWAYIQQHIHNTLDADVLRDLEQYHEYEHISNERFRSFNSFDLPVSHTLRLLRERVEPIPSVYSQWLAEYDRNNDNLLDRSELGPLFRTLLPQDYYPEETDSFLVDPIIKKSFEDVDCKNCAAMLPFDFDFVLNSKFVKANYKQLDEAALPYKTNFLEINAEYGYYKGSTSAIARALRLRRMTTRRSQFSCLNNLLIQDGDNPSLPKFAREIDEFFEWQFPEPSRYEKAYYEPRVFYETYAWKILMHVVRHVGIFWILAMISCFILQAPAAKLSKA